MFANDEAGWTSNCAFSGKWRLEFVDPSSLERPRNDDWRLEVDS
jgi:hypothetical protein